jgi:4-hydroxy-2-oxoheptanedioate aldolase
MTTLSALPAMVKAAQGEGRTLMSAWLGMPDPWIAGVMAQEPFDLVTYDMQHSALSYDTVVRGIPLVQATGKPVAARIPVGDFATASRLLDAGCSGIIAPMTNTVEQARDFANACKYPQIGERSWGAYGALGQSGLSQGDYFKTANGFTTAIAMIETREALAVVDGILALPGIDGVLIGPSDLSIALSGGKELNPMHPDVDAAIHHVRARSRAVGKSLWVYCHSTDRAREMRAAGVDVVCLLSDTGMLRAGASAALKAARS